MANFLKTLILIFFSFSCKINYAQQSLKAELDSCYEALEYQDDDNRMITYYNFFDQHRWCNCDTMLTFLDLYEADAEKIGDCRNADQARYYKISILWNNAQIKSTDIYDEYIAKCNRLTSNDIFLRFLWNKIEFLIVNTQLQTARIEIEKHLSETDVNDYIGLATLYGLLGKTYQAVSNNKSAVEYEMKSIEYCRHTKDYNLICDIYYDLCNAIQQSKEYQNLLKYTDEWWTVIDKAEQLQTKQFNARLRRILCLQMRGLAYYETKQIDELQDTYTQMFELSNGGQDLTETIKSIEIFNLILHEQYTEALRLIDEEIDFSKQMGYLSQSPYVYVKADVLHKIGDDAEAYLAQKEYGAIADSAFQAINTNQLNEFATIYKVEQHKTAEKIAHNRFIISLVAVVLLIIIALIIAIYNRKLKHRIKILCQQIDKMSDMREQLLNRDIANNIDEKFDLSIDKSNNKSENKNDDFSFLFSRLEILFQDVEIFTKPNVDRDYLAAELGTNRTYLANCIKKSCSKSTSDYIATKRLERAISIMKNNAYINMTELSDEVGFATYSTFFRQFSKEYGVTPIEYKNYLNKKTA